MITQESINFIKKHVLITDYLASRGIQPHIEQRGQFLYFSPLRDERTPSFWVDPQKNLFNDFGNTKHGGDIIRLVQLLEKCDFVSAVKHLDIFYGQHGNCHFFLSCQKTSLSTNK